MEEDHSTLPVSSSTPAKLSPEELECYRDALNSLVRAEIPFAVAGAFAFQRHTGISRSTKDLDFVLEPRHLPKALSSLQDFGLKTHIEDPIWLAKAVRGDYFVDLITALGNAVLVVDASWIDRAVPGEILGVPCRILNAEEIIASKLFVSRRERFDGADIAHLIRSCGDRLDWDRVCHLLGVHWELLLWGLVFFAYIYPSRVGLVPQHLWRDLSLRFQDRIDHANKDEPFRGTLIDPNMFAIDVAEWGERDLYHEYCRRHPLFLRHPASRIGSKE